MQKQDNARPVSISRRLKTQLTLMFITLLVLMMVSVGLVIYRQVENVLEKQSASITNQFLVQSEHNIRSLVDEVNFTLKNIMLSSALNEYLSQGWQKDFDSIQLVNLVFEQCANAMMYSESIHSLYFSSSNGNILGITPSSRIVSSDSYSPLLVLPESLAENLASKNRHPRWLGGYTSQDFAGNNSEKSLAYPPRLLTYVHPFSIRYSNTAYMIVNINEAYFAETFTKSDLGHQRETYLVDSSGIILSHSDPAQVGAPFRHTLQNAASEENFIMEDDLQINYYHIDSLNWFIISEVPRDVLYQDINSIQRVFLLAILLALVVALGISQYWIYRLTRPLDRLRKAMRQMEQGQLGGQLEEHSKNELGMLGRQFDKMSKSIQNLIRQIRDIEGEKRKREMEALRAQINPHFLYNTLSNIKYMAVMNGADDVAQALTTLGSLLRPIYKTQGEFWNISAELSYLQHYVAIMNCRFGGIINMEYDIEDRLLHVPILRFILQPLVENAIEHNTNQQGAKRCIHLRMWQQNAQVMARVSDDGPGIPPEKLATIHEMLQNDDAAQKEGSGVGLSNVHRRIRSYYGSNYSVQVNSACGAGVQISFSFPLPEQTGISEQKTE